MWFYAGWWAVGGLTGGIVNRGVFIPDIGSGPTSLPPRTTWGRRDSFQTFFYLMSGSGLGLPPTDTLPVVLILSVVMGGASCCPLIFMILIIAIIINIMIAIVTVNVGITGIIIIMKTFFFFRCYYDVVIDNVSIRQNCFFIFFMFEKAPSKIVIFLFWFVLILFCISFHLPSGGGPLSAPQDILTRRSDSICSSKQL